MSSDWIKEAENSRWMQGQAAARPTEAIVQSAQAMSPIYRNEAEAFMKRRFPKSPQAAYRMIAAAKAKYRRRRYPPTIDAHHVGRIGPQGEARFIRLAGFEFDGHFVIAMKSAQGNASVRSDFARLIRAPGLGDQFF